MPLFELANRTHCLTATILDFDAKQIDVLRQLGLTAYYGDATRLEILRTAGAEKARLILIMIDSEAATLRMSIRRKNIFPRQKSLSAPRTGPMPTVWSKREWSISTTKWSEARFSFRSGH